MYPPPQKELMYLTAKGPTQEAVSTKVFSIMQEMMAITQIIRFVMNQGPSLKKNKNKLKV